jgi:hypothetical protein
MKSEITTDMLGMMFHVECEGYPCKKGDLGSMRAVWLVKDDATKVTEMKAMLEMSDGVLVEVFVTHLRRWCA